MSRWNETQQQATIFVVHGGYIEYYDETITMVNGYAGRIEPGKTIGVIYMPEKDAMQITSCYKLSALGKYIISPKNQKGKVVLTIPSTTKAIREAKVVIAANNALVPENTDGGGNTYGSDPSVMSEVTELDDVFVDAEYSERYKNIEQYQDDLKNGLRVKDLRGILGMPHQFMPIADPRIDFDEDSPGVGNISGFGRVYSEKIIKHIPLLLMTPGVPKFMTSYSKSQRDKIFGKLAGLTTEPLDAIFSDGRSGKYYSLKFAYTEYFHYVNAMLRSAAYFLDIQGETIDDKKLGTLNWLYMTSSLGSEIYGHGNLCNFLGPYAGSIAFYADAGTTVDESFSNSTTESQLASTLNNVSDQGREINFLIGNVGSMAGLNLSRMTGADDIGNSIDTLTDQVDNILGSHGNIFSNILSKASTILAGGRLIFPEIWSDSSFSRSYSCSMKLVSPSGDKLSVFLNILVPIYHLLGFTLPRQAAAQAYFSPFLVRAYYKGLFNVDMGIIPGLSITKGDEGEWTLDGLPTVANVSFEIKDLYDGLYMSKFSFDNDYSIMSNIQELDYIANSCGINVNDQEVMRSVKMYWALGFSRIKDKVTIDIFGGVSQYFNQKMQNIFGKFK